MENWLLTNKIYQMPWTCISVMLAAKLQSQLENCTLNCKYYMDSKIKKSFFLNTDKQGRNTIGNQKLQTKQSAQPRYDGHKIIKLCPEIFANILEKNYNRAIEMGTYPHYMKIAEIIALFKKDKTFDPNNYRPISLLSHFDKIFEKILCKILILFLEINKIYHCHQFGFRKGYFTAMALTEIVDCIKHLLDEKSYLDEIFIDFK